MYKRQGLAAVARLDAVCRLYAVYRRVLQNDSVGFTRLGDFDRSDSHTVLCGRTVQELSLIHI